MISQDDVAQVFGTRLRDAAVLSELRAAFSRRPALPVQISHVLPAEVATEVAHGLSGAANWHEECFLEDVLGGIRRAEKTEFDTAPRRARLATWEKLHVGSRNLPYLTELLDHLRAPDTVNAYQELGLAGVTSPRIKIMRYRPGDFFARHSDGDMSMALLLYFTSPEWKHGDGGELCYEDEEGRLSIFPPIFNSAIAFPYHGRTTHWVNPVQPTAGLRYTISVDYAA
jgi:hypothetical protein